MQDDPARAALNVQEPQKPADDMPLQLPKQKPAEADGMVNKADRVIPQQEAETPAKSKFAGNSSIARQLTAAELNARLNIDELDASKVKVKEAWQDGQETKIKLDNGDTIQFGRDSDGYAKISVPEGQPPDVTTMMAMSSLARSKGWKEINVSGGEEFRALSFFTLANEGIKMLNPPDAAVLEQYRDRFEQTLKTGIDPKTAERQAQNTLIGASDKPIAPTAKIGEPEADKKPRPSVKASAPAMR
jgi:hypothetical protein